MLHIKSLTEPFLNGTEETSLLSSELCNSSLLMDSSSLLDDDSFILAT